ncbi:uncharacterized protein LOC130267674 [Hyla sarda]|uniref:uncharacterized protein LOC130267673 n=1 Tax=Hyla sarda TaxID=327740 RepID=UPI0024C20F01|nr:uncharacterized protein LOC130267673 [Hyla sarda]XP_056373728.1 uncharacterized protein LOC130267674 [Hyla sarda]
MEPTPQTSVAPSNTFSYSPGEIDRILSSIKEDASFLHAPSMVDLQRQYENFTKRLLSLTLHLTTLSEYYRAQRIPRGLRSQPKDNSYAQDPDYRTRFELISNKYSLDLILLNIEFLQKDISSTQTRINTIDESLKLASSQEDYDKLIQKQTLFLQKFRTELENTKRHKWHRDTNDYASNRVYTWNQLSLHKRMRKGRDFNVDFNMSNNANTKTSSNTGFENDNNVTFLGLDTLSPTDPPDGGAAVTDGPIRTRAQRDQKPTQRKFPYKKK